MCAAIRWNSMALGVGFRFGGFVFRVSGLGLGLGLGLGVGLGLVLGLGLGFGLDEG